MVERKFLIPDYMIKIKNFSAKSGPFDVFLYVLRVEGEKFDTFKALK